VGAPRVLLVDDDKKLLPLLERGFRYEGFEVLAAANGEEGLNLARTRTPDVVILDIGLPVLDGFEVCHLRRHVDVPIIMLTARDEVADKVSAWPHHVAEEDGKSFNSGVVPPGERLPIHLHAAGSVQLPVRHSPHDARSDHRPGPVGSAPGSRAGCLPLPTRGTPPVTRPLHTRFYTVRVYTPAWVVHSEGRGLGAIADASGTLACRWDARQPERRVTGGDQA
jgi:CheY-like chemotaxis protein